MATTTRPRGATHTALSDGDRLAHAKKMIAQARSKAARIAKDTELERSTRTRRAMKVKADALDQVASVLQGK